MPEFKPTPEQQAIIEAARDTSDNLIIQAYAGAAKTTTLELIAQALPHEDILAIAFNRRIKEEMSKRMPANTDTLTLNGLGHRIWQDAIGRRCILDVRKNYKLLQEAIEEQNGDDKGALYKNFQFIFRAISGAKTAGYAPSSAIRSRPLMTAEEFYDEWLEEEPSDFERVIIDRVLIRSIEKAFSGTIDYDDQILMPSCFSAPFPRPRLVLIDEAQDLSALNHRMLGKLVRHRLIAVGDECQSIYGFRGAHEDSMKLLKATFEMRELPLTVSFRAPRSIVEHVKWRAPAIQAPEWAKEGEIIHKTQWSVHEIPDGATVICRNNAPLFSLAVRMFANGRYARLVGNDIGKMLVKVLKTFGPVDTPQDIALRNLEVWQAEKEAKSRDKDKVRDQALCLRIFIEQGDTLGAAINFAEQIINQAGPVELMTGHKSKGLEFDDVFILDRDLIRLKYGQERNLMYVMATRTKYRLTYINTTDCTEHQPTESDYDD